MGRRRRALYGFKNFAERGAWVEMGGIGRCRAAVQCPPGTRLMIWGRAVPPVVTDSKLAGYCRWSLGHGGAGRW
jgi:hypothetical protein